MQALKNNYEKFILGILLVAFVGSGVYWITYLQHVKTVASGGAIIDVNRPEKKLPALAADEFQGLKYLRSPDVNWGLPTQKGDIFSGRDYKQCADETCQHWIAFTQKTCPWCGDSQPAPKADEPNPLKGKDRDNDGIADDIEATFPFLRADRPQDGWQDEDKDGFLNREEFIYFRNLDENSDGKSMADPKIHPPLATHLRLLAVKRDVFGIRLKTVLALEKQDKKTWEIHLSVRDRFGRIRTRFTKLGDVVNGYKISDVEKKQIKYFNKSVRDYMFRDASIITLDKGDEKIRLTVGQTKYTGVVARLIFDSPFPKDREVLRPVREGDTLQLRDSAGQIEKYAISAIGQQRLTATLLVNGQASLGFTIDSEKRVMIPPEFQPSGENQTGFDGMGMEGPN